MFPQERATTLSRVRLNDLLGVWFNSTLYFYSTSTAKPFGHSICYVDDWSILLRNSRAANTRKSIKHVAEITIQAIFPASLSIGVLVQKITSAFA